MKRLLIILLILALPLSAYAAKQNIQDSRLFSATVVAASATVKSVPVDLKGFKPDGYFTLHVSVTSGTGTVKLTYELANTTKRCTDPAVVYVTPSTASDIVTAHTVSSGPGSDGNDLYSFTPELGVCMKIVAEETGTSNPITITADLAVQ